MKKSKIKKNLGVALAFIGCYAALSILVVLGSPNWPRTIVEAALFGIGIAGVAMYVRSTKRSD
ncbi:MULTISPECIES: hypothetical protein, partial [Bacteroides]|uniref:hypothetical protein n=1 Tax=Bacteroides TaxID=816 RepID=UPI001D384BEC